MERQSKLIERLLPTDVVVADTLGDTLLDGELFAAEQALIDGAVEQRRREFHATRICAHRALQALGLPASPVLMGAHGEPRWPRGVVGSITHCEGYRACAVARTHDVSALGIDAEPDAALPVGVLEVIASHEERIRLREYWLVAPEISWDRLLFSAKESVYKALYPLTGRRLGFEDAAISFAPRSGAFCAHLSSAATEPLLPLLTELLQDGRVVLQGRWASSGGLVLTAIALSGARRCSPADRMRADGGEAGHDKSGA